MWLTERDRRVVEAVHVYRILRRDQVQALFFPSARTAQRALARLFHHGYLQRRFLPTEYGTGQGQAIYLLDERGADLVVSQSGVDRGDLSWRRGHNQVGGLFLEHTLAVNDVRIAVSLAARGQGWRIERWIDEDQLRSREAKDYVEVKWVDSRGSARRRRMAVVADGYFLLNFGKRAHFFLEVDQGTVPNKRWATKVRTYLAYWNSGKYERRYQTQSLRILTVTSGEGRLRNLKATTEQAGGKRIFWFTTFEKAISEDALTTPIWQMAGQDGSYPVVAPE